jgi:hypothetical protein
MKLLFILFVSVRLWATCSGSGASWSCTSGSTQSQVQTAVTSTSVGGTVALASGSYTWATPVSLTRGIIVSGAGAGVSTITSSGGSILFSVAPTSTAITNEENIRITGFTIDGAASSVIMIQLAGASGVSGTKPYRSVIIDHNTFQNHNPSSSTQVGAVIQSDANGNGQIRGVIHHNTFDRCNIILRIFSNNDTSEWANTAFNDFAYGNSDNLFFEDNTIQYSSSYSGDNPGWVEIGQGGRIVMRYNTWNLTNATTPQEVWDVHGFQNWNGSVNSGQTSTMIIEAYGNALSSMGTYRWINHRGSWGLFFDNVLSGSGANSIEYNQYQGCGNGDINPDPTNYTPYVNNTYAFNNTQGGTNHTMAVGAAGDACSLAANTNYWNYNSGCTTSTCATGVGTGTGTPSGTCTTGVGFWKATTATATTTSSIIQAGTLYKCTSTNTWTAYYTPYTYPHPLQGATSAPTVTTTTASSITATTASSGGNVTSDGGDAVTSAASAMRRHPAPHRPAPRMERARERSLARSRGYPRARCTTTAPLPRTASARPTEVT